MVKGQKMGQTLTHCQYGHEFTENNIIYRKRDRGRGEEITRICKICHSRRNKKFTDNLTEEQKLNRNLKVREWRKEHKGYVRNMRLKSSFGITLEDYNSILKSQNNKCLICGREPNGVNLVVDHDHSTGKIRGLLCSRCNRSLGWYEKCKEGIESYMSNTTEKLLKVV